MAGKFSKPNTNTEPGSDPQPQLYDLSAGLGEKDNVAARHPDQVKELKARLDQIRQAGRSRP